MSKQNGTAPRHPNTTGETGLFVMGYDEGDAYGSLAKQLTKQVEPTPETAPDRGDETGGIIRRSNEFRSQLGPVMLESVGLGGMEIAKANERRARDLYRNKFPLLVPAFERVCRNCELTFDEGDVHECPRCGEDTEPPDEEQRAWASDFFGRVNKEGQSLGELYQSLAKDGGRLGGWVHIVRYNYGILNGAVMQEPRELKRADPKRLKPVVDEHGRIGGHWWACPIHRNSTLVEKDEYADGHTHCLQTHVVERDDGTTIEQQCNAELREVFFAEVETVGSTRTSGDDTPERVYFNDEVIDFAAFNERLDGHDWLSPVEHVWKRQAILEWMNTYAGAFFDDQNTDRFPGRILMLHTSNKDLVEKQLKEASDERQQDPYKNGVLYNTLPREGGGGGDQAQVLDLASEEIIGQSPDLKKDFKSDIRGVYGQVDVQDSELEDAGGLNNEGLQLTVKNDAIASWQAELRDGPLSKLTRVLGITDWDIQFVPPEAPEEETPPEELVNAVATAEQAGVAYQIEDGRFILADTDGVVEPEGETPGPEDTGGGGSPFEQSSGGWDSPPGMQDRVSDGGIAREAVRRASDNLEAEDAVEGARWIGDVYDAMMNHDLHGEVEKQAQWSSERQVPEFAQELLEDAILGGAVEKPEAMSNAELPLFEAVLQRNLVTEGRWTIPTITQDVEQTLNVEADTAENWTVNGVQNVVQAALELGYMVEGNLDEREFYMGGPDDTKTCEACEAVIERTNPHEGGSPVQLDEFRDLAVNAAEQHGIGGKFVRGGFLHPSCRHRIVESR